MGIDDDDTYNPVGGGGRGAESLASFRNPDVALFGCVSRTLACVRELLAAVRLYSRSCALSTAPPHSPTPHTTTLPTFTKVGKANKASFDTIAKIHVRKATCFMKTKKCVGGWVGAGGGFGRRQRLATPTDPLSTHYSDSETLPPSFLRHFRTSWLPTCSIRTLAWRARTDLACRALP